MTALQIAGAVLIPLAVVVALLGFDRLLQFGQRHPRSQALVWPLLTASTAVSAIGRATEGRYGWGFALNVAMVVVCLIGWIAERRKARSSPPAS